MQLNSIICPICPLRIVRKFHAGQMDWKELIIWQFENREQFEDEMEDGNEADTEGDDASEDIEEEVFVSTRDYCDINCQCEVYF